MQAEFRNAAAKHEKQLFDLLAKRGMDPRERASRVPLDIGINDVAAVLQASYPDGTALVLYEIDDSGFNVWAVSSDTFAMESVSIGRAELSRYTRRLRQGLGVDQKVRSRRPIHRDAVIDEEPGEDQAQGADVLGESTQILSRILFPESIAELVQSSSISHVVIVPSGNLGTVPFSLLDVNGLFLIDHVSTTIAPSLGDLFQENQIGRDGGLIDLERTLVVGNPAYADPEWNLPDLPGAEHEARAVAARFGVEPLISENATKSSVLSRLDGSIVYLATHGVASEANPLDASFIALTPVPNDEKSGRWTARDIQNDWIGARLVVLSACQTGLGGVHDAGVIGLSRAFQLAGCRQVVMSLWSIDDKSTADLMVRFAEYVADGLHVPEALRRSSIDVRDEGALPWQWSSFTVFAGPFG